MKYACIKYIFPTKEVRSIVYLYVILLLPGFVQPLNWVSELAHPRISNCCGQLYKVDALSVYPIIQRSQNADFSQRCTDQNLYLEQVT